MEVKKLEERIADGERSKMTKEISYRGIDAVITIEFCEHTEGRKEYHVIRLESKLSYDSLEHSPVIEFHCYSNNKYLNPSINGIIGRFENYVDAHCIEKADIYNWLVKKGFKTNAVVLDSTLKEFIEDFWEDKKFRCGEDDKGIWYSYASHVGKYHRANILDEILVDEFTPIEVYLWTAIMRKLKCGRDFMENGVVYLTYPDFRNVCSDRVFMETKRKFVKFELLIETPHKKWFIINPLYTSKFYKLTEDK